MSALPSRARALVSKDEQEQQNLLESMMMQGQGQTTQPTITEPVATNADETALTDEEKNRKRRGAAASMLAAGTEYAGTKRAGAARMLGA